MKEAVPPGPGFTAHGARVDLVPVDPVVHAAELHAAFSDPQGDPHLWDYLPYGPFAGADEYRGFLEVASASTDPLFRVVVPKATGRAAGILSLMAIVPEHGRIEIGNICFGPALQRTPEATESIFLLARAAFGELGNRRLEWKCNARNARSRRAAERFGFTYEGTLRQHMIVKGENRDTAWFSILDGEWPAVRSAFEGWLDPANFDDRGQQRAGLAALRRSGASPGHPGGKPSPMITVEHLEDWRGQEVIDPDGEGVGKLEEIFYAEGEASPMLITVKSGLLGRKTRVIPLVGASIGRNYVRVAHSKAVVEHAPDLPGDTADASHVLEVREHFGADSAPAATRIESSAARATREREAEEVRARALEAEARAADARAGAEDARRQAEDAHRRAEEAAADEEAARRAAESRQTGGA